MLAVELTNPKLNQTLSLTCFCPIFCLVLGWWSNLCWCFLLRSRVYHQTSSTVGRCWRKLEATWFQVAPLTWMAAVTTTTSGEIIGKKNNRMFDVIEVFEEARRNSYGSRVCMYVCMTWVLALFSVAFHSVIFISCNPILFWRLHEFRRSRAINLIPKAFSLVWASKLGKRPWERGCARNINEI